MNIQGEIDRLLREGHERLNALDLHAALEVFLQALELDSKNPEVHYFLGITYARVENYEKSVTHLQSVLDSELAYINKVHAQMVLGYIYTLQEEYENALNLFQSIVEAGFQNAQAYAAIGYIMDRCGNFKEAVMHLYRALELDPDNANAHNSLGYMYAEANLNLEEALSECKKAVALDQNNPAYLDSMGWVYYKLGKISMAKSYLRRALKMAPDNEEIKTHLKTVSKGG
jgi:tetratricopeptide (TPR) repeat protein